MNMTENKTTETRTPKWMKSTESVMSVSTEIPSGTPELTVNETSNVEMTTTSNSWTTSYILEEPESEISIVEELDYAGATNQFIAESLHDIASQATKTTTIWIWEDIEHIEVPDWHARLAAVKQITDLKGLRGVKHEKRKERKQGIYVLVN